MKGVIIFLFSLVVGIAFWLLGRTEPVTAVESGMVMAVLMLCLIGFVGLIVWQGRCRNDEEIAELRKLNKFLTDRELKMIELKKKIRLLEGKGE